MSELRGILDEWTGAIVLRDVAAADSILADDFVLTSAGGVAPRMSREAWLAALAEIETRSLEVEIVEERHLGDVAVVVSTLTWDASLGSRDLSGVYAITDVFERADGRWWASWRVSARLSESLP